jgi:hypothetical protein
MGDLELTTNFSVDWSVRMPSFVKSIMALELSTGYTSIPPRSMHTLAPPVMLIVVGRAKFVE